MKKKKVINEESKAYEFLIWLYEKELRCIADGDETKSLLFDEIREQYRKHHLRFNTKVSDAEDK